MLKIIAGHSIDEYQLGMNYKQLKEALGNNYTIENLSKCDVVTTDNFKFWIEKSTNIVSQISVFGNYDGKFLERIGIGNTLKDIENNIGKYEEELDVYIVPEYPGICFELKDVNNYEDEWDELTAPIEYISIFHKDYHFCRLLNVCIFDGDCYDINMVRENYIKSSILESLENELGFKIDLSKSKLICKECRYDHLGFENSGQADVR